MKVREIREEDENEGLMLAQEKVSWSLKQIAE